MSSKQRREERIPLHILDAGARRGWVVSAILRPLHPRENDSAPIVQQA
jgi:hypothetical protein